MQAMRIVSSNFEMREGRVCTACDPPHVENCEECFGFGVYRNGHPVRAGHAKAVRDTDVWLRCGFCGGTPYGVAMDGEGVPP